MNSSEARVEAAGNEVSLLRVTKAEIDLNEGIDEHSKEVYDKVVENFNMFKNKGWLVKENEPKLYIYAQTMDGRTQYGIVGCTHIDDYFNNNIKKHELTRKDKEDDRMIHVNITNANVEPVFFAYPAHKEIDQIVSEVVNNEKAIYDFVAKEDGFGHKFWVINDQSKIKRIEEIFENEIPSLYVANWNHKTPCTNDYYLDYYMSKNLYYLQCSDCSGFNNETYVEGKRRPVYITLSPTGEPYDKRWSTSNESWFWASPYK
jgi:uncharacterized protein (DUF1015 family)